MTLEQGIVEAVRLLEKDAKWGVYPWQVAQKMPEVDDRLWYCERAVRGRMAKMVEGGMLNRVHPKKDGAKYGKRGYLAPNKNTPNPDNTPPPAPDNTSPPAPLQSTREGGKKVRIVEREGRKRW